MMGYAASYAYVASASIVSDLRRAAVTRPVLPHSWQPTILPEQLGHDASRARRTLSSQSWSGHTTAKSIRNGSSPSTIRRRAASPRFMSVLS